jgi:hypothetical protein
VALSYENLEPEVRECMLRELETDLMAASLYISPRLTPEGAELWPSLLREAVESHDDTWLESQLRDRGLLEALMQRRKPSGGFTMARVPSNAAEMLAEGEFNRLYARGLCLHTLECGGEYVVACRGRFSASPRPESEAKVGQTFVASSLLADLRSSQGLEPALGLPQVNSGITIRRP